MKSGYDIKGYTKAGTLVSHTLEWGADRCLELTRVLTRFSSFRYVSPRIDVTNHSATLRSLPDDCRPGLGTMRSDKLPQYNSKRFGLEIVHAQNAISANCPTIADVGLALSDVCLSICVFR